MSPDPRKVLGKEGEDLAARHLEKNGYTIVSRNFSCRYGEIDLVAEKAKELHFVEVKTRRDNRFIEPEEVVTGRKQAKLRNLAQIFLSDPRSARFQEHEIYLDVVAIVLSPENRNHSIKHLTGVF